MGIKRNIKFLLKLKKMLNVNKDKRISIFEALKHKFLKIMKKMIIMILILIIVLIVVIIKLKLNSLLSNLFLV